MRASEGPACGRIAHGPHPLSPSPRCGEGERRATISSFFFLPERRGVVILSERANARERRTCLWSHHAWSSPPVPLSTDVASVTDGPPSLPFFLFRCDA